MFNFVCDIQEMAPFTDIRNKFFLYLISKVQTLYGIHCSVCLIELCFPVVTCCLIYFPPPLLFLCEESPSVTSRFARRTHTCGDLNEGIIGQEVHLCGWVELKRLGRFLTLRDGYGAAQLVAPNNVSMG